MSLALAVAKIPVPMTTKIVNTPIQIERNNSWFSAYISVVEVARIPPRMRPYWIELSFGVGFESFICVSFFFFN